MKVYILQYNCDADYVDRPMSVAPLECRICNGEEQHFLGVFDSEVAAWLHMGKCLESVYDKEEYYSVTEYDLNQGIEAPGIQ